MSNANGRRPPRHPDEQRLVEAAEASAALRQLLAAASAPPSAAELKGRSQAIAAFRGVHRPVIRPQPAIPRTGQPASERRTPARLARVSRWSAARLTVAGAALAVLLGGTAAAAAAGELPAALQNAVSDLLNPPAGVGSPPAPDRSSAVPTAQPTPGLSHAVPSLVPNGPPTTGSASGTPTRPPGAAAATPPQLSALCRAYQSAGSPAATLATPGFAPLVTAADGVAGVTGFCSRLIGPARTVAPSSHSSTPQSVSTQSASSQSASSESARAQPASSESASSESATSQSASSQAARAQPAYPHRLSGGREGGSRVSPAASGAWRGGNDQAWLAATSMD
ncbi:MAG TPA: hypothetical protein VGB75_02710 [Jatrophihabitans sp.]|uniref:hypothetical protein n=1 Tax=Jatrophihabitans sp. TaxID=1932789 RepID=UPI002F241C34